MGLFSPDHPYTSVTAIINRIIENHSGQIDDGTMELELPELLESTQMQNSGATEAARAIRKKLKYGSNKEKLNALQVLELLVANGGKKLSPLYNDSKLLERVKTLVLEKGTLPVIKKQAVLMVIGWNDEYKGNSVYKGLTDLYTQLPMQKYVKKKKPAHDFMNDEADDTTPFEVIGGGTNTNPGRTDDEDDDQGQEASQEFYSSKNYRSKLRSDTTISADKTSQRKTNQQINREYKIPRINYVKEKPKINQLIADASSSSIKLANSLQTLRPSENPVTNEKCEANFNQCRETRRKVLRYLQLVDHEAFLGPLIHANDELIDALEKYSKLAEKFVDAESEEEEDDDDYDDESVDTRPGYSSSDDEVDAVSESINNFQIPKRAPPPIPPKSPGLRSPRLSNNIVQDTEGDEDDPFGDSKKTEYPAAWS